MTVLRILPFLLAIALHAATPFKIIDAGIRQGEDGPSMPGGTTFVPGEVIFFSCRLEGYQVSPVKKVALQYEFTAVDPSGVAIIEPVSEKIEAELAAEDKDWKPKIRQTVLVPSFADSGSYKMRVTVKDTLSGEVRSAELSFVVRGHAVEPAATVTVRNFSFYRKEDDTAPLAVAAYRPGDAVWARFDIAGYKFGAGNMRDVAYTVTVTAESGRVLLPPGEPSGDKGTSFYPVRYVPCVISLNLQPNIAPGAYTVAIRAEDRVGGQSSESKQVFRVE